MVQNLNPGMLMNSDTPNPEDQVRPSQKAHIKPIVNVWRPSLRAPIAMLTVCDDGQQDGEVIRIRSDRFVIGRTEGDFLIPHDAQISTKHVEITRQQIGGLWRWVITDLQSTNGLFVRMTRIGLKDRREILAGGGRYRFDAPESGPDGTIDHLPGDDTPSGSTHTPGSPARHAPALTELIGPSSIGNRIVLNRTEYWIGSDPDCAISRPDDPFCEPRQVRIFLTPKGWLAEHPKTVNGLWVRMPQMVVDRSLQFQLGEQRFKLVI